MVCNRERQYEDLVFDTSEKWQIFKLFDVKTLGAYRLFRKIRNVFLKLVKLAVLVAIWESFSSISGIKKNANDRLKDLSLCQNAFFLKEPQSGSISVPDKVHDIFEFEPFYNQHLGISQL